MTWWQYYIFVTKHHLLINILLDSMIREASSSHTTLTLSSDATTEGSLIGSQQLLALQRRFWKPLSNFLLDMASLQIIMCWFWGEDITELHQNAVSSSHLQSNMWLSILRWYIFIYSVWSILQKAKIHKIKVSLKVLVK